ncbi:MAG: hypothetical protein M1840_004911 [Geoglossum simile]|nr:MAG: hypothetical protein M1840_004911 [Geoglossum simile]
MGLQVLYPPNEAGKAEVLKADIVAVHGLNGDPKNTWTNHKASAFWLKDFLPLDVPNVRVMTFGYNSSAAFGNTTADIRDHAKGLLSSLVDKREEGDEMRRSIIFIGHSLGGIALFQARIEQRYNSISEYTTGIIFLGTPHRGSEGTAYGKVLATVATAVLNKPPPRLVNALKVNSGELMRLTTEFRFQLPKYQVYSFYEMKPVKILSALVVEKHSALLDIDGEEQIPVDANHEDMCKFALRDDDVYEKLFKRIRRILRVKDADHSNSDNCTAACRNRHYYVPHGTSGIFTGRESILRNLREECLSSEMENRPVNQKIFVLYGLGGSGKTQTCIKFAQDHRERFWAIFWIDASSQTTTQQGFLEIARICGIEGNPMAVKQWLTNTRNLWLLIFDNADDPAMDISEFFPTSNRGCILLTTRNPACKIHATVGSCELGGMDPDEAATLLLRAAGVKDVTAGAVQEKATLIATTLGCLALAIVQAGAYIRNGFCSIGEYCDIYSRHRERLLRHLPVQKRSDYQYSVYTTWEVSVETIKRISSEASVNAIKLIRIFCFLHYDQITEDIFERAWANSSHGGDLYKNIANKFYMRSQEGLAEWNPIIIREAAVLLASFSLIKIDETDRHMSMHPLVHVWARDRLSEKLQKHFWVTASFTLAAAISLEFQLSDYSLRRSLVSHIESCIFLCKDKPFLGKHSEMGRIFMANRFALAFSENGRFQNAMELREKALEVGQEMLGNEHPYTLSSVANLASSYGDLGRNQEAMEMREKALELSRRTLGNQHPNTLKVMAGLAISYDDLGRRREAVELKEKVLEASQRTLGNEHPDTLSAKKSLAISYNDLGRKQEALRMMEIVLEVSQRTLGNEHPNTLDARNNLALSYRDIEHWKEALELMEKALEVRQRTMGSEHPDTLKAMNNLAICYRDVGRGQEAIELWETVVEVSQRMLGNEHPDTLSTKEYLAISYSDLGRGQEATELWETVVEVSQRMLGNEHPRTFNAMNNLAVSYRNVGRRQEAIKMMDKALEASRKILGNKHPNTLKVMNNPADIRSHPTGTLEVSQKILETWHYTNLPKSISAGQPESPPERSRRDKLKGWLRSLR